MSVTFYMENKKKLLSNKIMSVKELLEIIPDLTQFTFDESLEDFDVERFYKSKISEYECLLMGVEGRSARGFECSHGEYDGKKNYEVRVYTPSSIEDWKVAMDFISALAKKLNVKIVSEHGEEFTYESIREYPYLQDIEYGIESIMFNESVNDDSNSTIFGIYRPVSFSKKMRDELYQSKHKAEDFSELITDIQYLDAYSANQQFYRMDDEQSDAVIGVYVITETVPTIVPYKPFVEFENMHLFDEETRDNIDWKMHFVCLYEDENGDMQGDSLEPIPYEQFIKRLPEDKYRFIDGDYILVEALSREEMEEIVA